MSDYPSVEDLLSSELEWREGIFRLMSELYAVVDKTISERDRHVQTWLYNNGHEWVGDPDKEFGYQGIPFYRLVSNTESQQDNILDAIKMNPEKYCDFLEYRDGLIMGTQELFVREPVKLCLVCTHVIIKQEELSEQRDVSVDTLDLYQKSKWCREVVSEINKDNLPHIEKDDDDWESFYLEHL